MIGSDEYEDEQLQADDYEQGENAKPNIYPLEWNKISTKLKERYNYTCENCGYQASNSFDKKFIACLINLHPSFYPRKNNEFQLFNVRKDALQ